MKRANSGQMIIISALLVALLLLSSAIYIVGVEKKTPSIQDETREDFFAVKQGITHALSSALANVSNGGNIAVLTENLNRLKSAFENHDYAKMLDLKFEPLKQSPYQGGFYISWGSNGKGTSSVCASVKLNSLGTSSTYDWKSSINVTSELHVQGYAANVDDASKKVEVVCSVLNENNQALAKDFEIYYKVSSNLTWTSASSLNIITYGNGTYCIIFNAETQSPNSTVSVSLSCHDQRGILIKADTTCVETSLNLLPEA
jgi:hypothetical protein